MAPVLRRAARVLAGAWLARVVWAVAWVVATTVAAVVVVAGGAGGVGVWWVCGLWCGHGCWV